MRATSESAEWICLATNLGLEMLSAACDQASSPRRPHFALFGMLLAIAAVLISIWELIYRGKKERVVLRKWGMLWWFYHRDTPFGTLPDIYGLVAGISQCICSIVQYVYCLRHADNPFKASLLPAIFLLCLGSSKLSNNRMNANTTDNKDSWENSSSTEEASLHPIPKYDAHANIPFLNDQEVEGNIEQLWRGEWELERELKWELARELKRELERELEWELEQLREGKQELEQMREQKLQERLDRQNQLREQKLQERLERQKQLRQRRVVKAD